MELHLVGAPWKLIVKKTGLIAACLVFISMHIGCTGMWRGTSPLILSKESYPEARIKIENIRYHDSDCCGRLDRKKFRINWYEPGESKDPLVVEIE